MGKKRVILGIAGILAMLITIFLLQPAPIDPAAFTPPAAPALAGLLAPNISSNGQGTFWLALFTLRNETADKLHPFPFLKAQMSKLPKIFWPKPKPYGLVLALDEEGKIIQSLHEPTGKHVKEITSVREYGGHLYLGSLHNDRIGRYKLP